MRKIFVAATLLLCSATPSYAATVQVAFMDVDTAHVDGAFLPPAGFDLNVVSSDNLVGGYIGAITATTIGPGVQTLYTAASNQDPNGIGPAAGTFLGGPVPFGIVDTSVGTIQVNLSSMFADHGPMDQNIGAIAIGTYDSLLNTYDMSWSTVLTQGANAGQVATFNFTGSAFIVPVPAALWLFASGLFGLVCVARKKTM
jgi:hypothetical protein